MHDLECQRVSLRTGIQPDGEMTFMLILAITLDIPINRGREVGKGTKPHGLDQDWRLGYYFYVRI